MDKVSIVVPIYNAGAFLENTIKSILNQTYNNWELLLIDDCSEDNSSDICLFYQNQDKRISLMKNEFNLGSAATRNRGLKVATGKYIVFVDSDDTIEPNYLECLYKNIDKYNVDIVWCNYKECLPDGTFQVRKHKLPIHKILNSKDILPLYFTNHTDGLGSMWNKIYKIEFLRKNDLLIDERMAIGEDWNFNLDAFQKPIALVAINDSLYNYIRQNQTSIMNSFHENHFELMCEMSQKLLCISERNNISYDSNIFWLSFLYNSLSFLHKAVKNGKDKDYVKEICNNVLFRKSLKEIKHISSLGLFYGIVLWTIRLQLFSITIFILSKK